MKNTVNSADEFEAVIQPIAGPVRIAPKNTKNFNSCISMSTLHRIGIALIDASPMHTIIEPQHNFYCLTVPLTKSLHIKDGNFRRGFSRDTAHLLCPDRELDTLITENCLFLGVTYMLDNLEEYAGKLLGSTDLLSAPKESSLSLTTPAGVNLVSLLSHICGQLCRDNPAQIPDLITAELEDDLVTALLLAMNETQRGTDEATLVNASKCQLGLAEDYLLDNLTNPVTRTKLADVAGASIRSLSRAFVKRHGIGPMRFLRERRLEAARMELINARPENTKVSDIALRYGFSELGKFSLLYKSVYKEKPSDTLKYQ
jgi:AraC-like DNA-binding protein